MQSVRASSDPVPTSSYSCSNTFLLQSQRSDPSSAGSLQLHETGCRGLPGSSVEWQKARAAMGYFSLGCVHFGGVGWG